MERNLHDDLSWTESKPGDLELKSGTPRGRRVRPHPRGPLVAPPTDFFRLYILLYPKNIRGSHENHFCTTATFCTREIPSWGLFGDLPEGQSITEGLYINTIASLMKRE